MDYKHPPGRSGNFGVSLQIKPSVYTYSSFCLFDLNVEMVQKSCVYSTRIIGKSKSIMGLSHGQVVRMSGKCQATSGMILGGAEKCGSQDDITTQRSVRLGVDCSM